MTRAHGPGAYLPSHRGRALGRHFSARKSLRRVDGIFLAPFEQGEIGPDLFRHACLMGLEGLVSKHAGRAYGAGRCQHWIKVKNPNHPAYRRVQNTF